MSRMYSSCNEDDTDDGQSFLPTCGTWQRCTSPWHCDVSRRTLELGSVGSGGALSGVISGARPGAPLQKKVTTNVTDQVTAAANTFGSSSNTGESVNVGSGCVSSSVTRSASLQSKTPVLDPSLKRDLTVLAPLPNKYLRRLRRRAQERRYTQAQSAARQVQDLGMLAKAALREAFYAIVRRKRNDRDEQKGKTEVASTNYYRAGVLLDNANELQQANKVYKKFLESSVAANNAEAETLAHHCLGINYGKMGEYDSALRHHQRHLENADQGGKLVAFTNLGLSYQALGDFEKAACSHQNAVEYATRLQSKNGQLAAVGNLAVTTLEQGDLGTAKLCLQYHKKAVKQKNFRQVNKEMEQDMNFNPQRYSTRHKNNNQNTRYTNYTNGQTTTFGNSEAGIPTAMMFGNPLHGGAAVTMSSGMNIMAGGMTGGMMNNDGITGFGSAINNAMLDTANDSDGFSAGFTALMNNANYNANVGNNTNETGYASNGFGFGRATHGTAYGSTATGNATATATGHAFAQNNTHANATGFLLPPIGSNMNNPLNKNALHQNNAYNNNTFPHNSVNNAGRINAVHNALSNPTMLPSTSRNRYSQFEQKVLELESDLRQGEYLRESRNYRAAQEKFERSLDTATAINPAAKPAFARLAAKSAVNLGLAKGNVDFESAVLDKLKQTDGKPVVVEKVKEKPPEKTDAKPVDRRISSDTTVVKQKPRPPGLEVRIGVTRGNAVDET